MNFRQLHEQLRQEMVRRIDRGVLTGSMLARQTGFDPAHISNFLRSKRTLSLEGLDRMLAAQMLSILDLVPDIQRQSRQQFPMDQSGFDAVPLVAHSTALHDPHILPHAVQDVLRIPKGIFDDMRSRRAASKRDWQRFVAIRLNSRQAAPMEPLLHPEALIVIDRHYNSLRPYHPGRLTIHAVRYDNTLVFRYLDFNEERLVLRPHNIDWPVEVLALEPNQDAADLIVGRVCVQLSEL
jgi:hypothetical protein